MKNPNLRQLTASLTIIASFLASISIVSADEFPSNQELAENNVSLRVKGYRFGGGIQPADNARPTGNGLEIVPAEGWGSGFIVRPDGTIVTNYHVASKAIEMEAIFENGARYSIKHIKVYDENKDLAVLKIFGSANFTPVSLGDSDAVEPRDHVLAVGNPGGRGLNITEGQVSQVVKDDYGNRVLIGHTAPIAPGSSGGALYKAKDVVGVNVTTWFGTQFHQAIPINQLKSLLAPQYDRPMLLEEVFQPSLENIIAKSEQLGAFSDTVPGASEQNPGAWSIRGNFEPLTDYLIMIRGPESVDLDLAVLATDQLIGYGTSNQPGVELVAISNESSVPVEIGVLNYSQNPANFGIVIHKITW